MHVGGGGGGSLSSSIGTLQALTALYLEFSNIMGTKHITHRKTDSYMYSFYFSSTFCQRYFRDDSYNHRVNNDELVESLLLWS
jgi:hypothetical protein